MDSRKSELLTTLAKAQHLAAELRNELAVDSELKTEVNRRAEAIKVSLQTPFDQVQDICFSTWHLPTTVTALNAGWLRVLETASPGDGVNISTIASRTGHDVSLIRRIFRFLAPLGVVKEVDTEIYCSTSLSSLLVSSLGMAGGLSYSADIYGPSCARIPDYFANNGYKSPPDIEQSICSHTLGLSFWKILDKQPQTAKAFNEFMEMARFASKSWVKVYPVQELNVKHAEEILLIDIGGGRGHELAELAKLKQSLWLSGKLILQDQPSVLEQVPTAWQPFFTSHPHDFFHPQPRFCHHARAYYMRYILHDWPDEDCIRILTHLRNAMKAGYSRLLINDYVLPDKGCGYYAAGFDMVMMTAFSGKERSMGEWNELIDRVGGLSIMRIFELEPTGASVIEVVKT